MYLALYQFHLPKMDDFGVIDFQAPRHGRTAGHNPLEPYLSVLDDGSESSVRVARALAVVVSIVVGIGSTGVGVLAVVPAVLWTALAVGVLLLMAFTWA